MSELEVAATVAAQAAALGQTVSATDGEQELVHTVTAAGGHRGRNAELPKVQNLAHFTLGHKLGAGGMGEVYQAHDISLDREVAIKLLPESVSASPQLRERFVREARAQARIRHPNVCHIYFIGEEEGRLFFAMELAEGQTLAAKLKADGPMVPEEVIDIGLQIARGLRAARISGFLHRDIKPSNVMLGSDGQVKILDFGLVNATGGGPAVGGIAETRGALGTPLYMSPEQARGDDVDFRTDMYSLGVTMHELSSGAPPFLASSIDELASAHQDTQRPRLRKRGTHKSAAIIDEVCDCLMAKQPEQRFADYDALIGKLNQLSVTKSPPVRAFPRWFAFLADLVAVALVVALIQAGVELAFRQSDFIDLLAPWFTGGGLLAYYAWAYRTRGSTAGMNIFNLRIVSTGVEDRPSWRQLLRRLWWQWGLFGLGLVAATLSSSLPIESGSRFSEGLGVTAIVGMVGGFLRVLLYGVWASRDPRMRTRWDKKSSTEIIFRPRVP